MDEEGFPERRAGPGAALQEDRRLHVYEREGDELGEAAGALLLLAQVDEVACPAPRRIGVPEHDRGRRAQPRTMSRLVNPQPLVRRDLVRADQAPHLVVEDLRG